MTEQNNDEWVLGRKRIVPEDATDPMVDAALAVDWCSENEKGTVHNIWHAMLAAAPTPPSTDRIAALEAERRIRKAGQVAIDDLIDRIDGTHPGNDDLADYMTRIVDACVRAALKGASHGI